MHPDPRWTVVAQLQQRLMAKPSKCSFARWAAHMRPADGVSGDLCIVGVGADGALWGLFADVMGHGQLAAAVNLAILAELPCLLELPPGLRLARLNQFLQNDEGVFATALSFDLHANGELLLSSAGHPPALLIDRQSSHAVPTAGGPPLGLFEADASYPEERLTLKRQQRLLCLSDGFLERSAASLRSKTVPLSVQKRLLAATSGVSLHSDISAIRRLLEAAVSGKRKATDDQTLLLLEFRGAPSKS